MHGKGLDQKVIKFSQDLRDSWLRPVVVFLDYLGLAPWFLSLMGCGFVVLALFNWWAGLFVVYLLLFFALVFDGLDGPLARYQKNADQSFGVFMDALCDSVGVAMVVVFLNAQSFVTWNLLLLYILNYFVLEFLIFMNLLRGMRVWVPIRSRTWLFLSAPLFSYYSPEYLELFLLIFGLYMLLGNFYLLFISVISFKND